MPQQRIIFIDVDGTILEHGELIAPSTATAIREARSAGHLVYICTGRAAGDVHPRVREIGFDGEITNGGAYVTRGTEILVNDPMPRASLDRVVHYLEAEGIGYFLQSHDGVYASPEMLRSMVALRDHRRALRAQSTTGEDDTTDLLDTVIESAEDTYPPVSAANLDEVAKAVFVSDRTDVVEHAQRALGDAFHVVPGSMPLPGGSNGEISPLGVNKGAAITRLLDALDLDPAQAVGIGDSWNDAEMFEVVGTSIAMGNAPEGVQALADHITTGVLDDGVHNALTRLGLTA